jgi:hypothetical protein
MGKNAKMKRLTPFPAGEVCTIPTYDGSNEATHPCIVDTLPILGHPWHNYRYWMAFTPYPGNNSDRFRLENPSFVASNDGLSWMVPDGVTNPVIPPPGVADLRRSLTLDIPLRLIFWYVRGTIKRISFNADPALFLDSNGTMLMAYVHTIKGGGHDEVVVASSSDGWRSIQDLTIVVHRFRERDAWEVNVPSIVQTDDSLMHVYYGCVPFDADGKRPRYDRTGLRRRTGRTMKTLGAPVNIHITYPPGRRLWHHEVRKHPDGRLVCFGTFTLDEGSPYSMTWPPVLDLHYGEFVDKDTLVFQEEPVLRPSQEGWDSQCIYKPTFLFEKHATEETLALWYSAQDAQTRRWRIGMTRQTV